jgi:hypothetical protein
LEQPKLQSWYFFQVVTHHLLFSGAPCIVGDYAPTWGGSAKPKIIASGFITETMKELMSTGTRDFISTENGGKAWIHIQKLTHSMYRQLWQGYLLL